MVNFRAVRLPDGRFQETDLAEVDRKVGDAGEQRCHGTSPGKGLGGPAGAVAVRAVGVGGPRAAKEVESRGLENGLDGGKREEGPGWQGCPLGQETQAGSLSPWCPAAPAQPGDLALSPQPLPPGCPAGAEGPSGWWSHGDAFGIRTVSRGNWGE